MFRRTFLIFDYKISICFIVENLKWKYLKPKILNNYQIVIENLGIKQYFLHGTYLYFSTYNNYGLRRLDIISQHR